MLGLLQEGEDLTRIAGDQEAGFWDGEKGAPEQLIHPVMAQVYLGNGLPDKGWVTDQEVAQGATIRLHQEMTIAILRPHLKISGHDKLSRGKISLG